MPIGSRRDPSCRLLGPGRRATPRRPSGSAGRLWHRCGCDGSLRYVTAYTVADGTGQGVPRWSSSSGAVAPGDRVVRPTSLTPGSGGTTLDVPTVPDSG